MDRRCVVKTKSLVRVVAAAVVTVTAYAMLGVAGLWGVALAAPCLVFAPHMVRGAVAERKTKRELNVALTEILAGSRERG